MNVNKYILGIVILLLALVYRFIPNVPNFSPILAAVLFSGATLLKKSNNFIIILALIYISDFILNNTILNVYYPDNSGIVWFSNYMIFTFIAYTLIFFVGKRLVNINKIFSVLGATILSSVIFFILTNVGAWVFDPMNLYPNSFSGVLMSIAAGIPFFKSSLLADLVFASIMFGSYYFLVVKNVKSIAVQTVEK